MAIFPFIALVPYLETMMYEHLAQRDFNRIVREQEERMSFRQMTRRSPSKEKMPLSTPVLAESSHTFSGGPRNAKGKAHAKTVTGWIKQVVAPRDGITWHNFRVPAFKFYTRLMLDIFLALFATLVSLVDANIQVEQLDMTVWRIVFFVWAIGGMIEEWSQILSDWKNELLSLWRADKISMYRADPFNWIDFFTFHCLFIALCLPAPGLSPNMDGGLLSHRELKHRPGNAGHGAGEVASPSPPPSAAAFLLQPEDSSVEMARVALWSLMTVGCWLRMLRTLQMIPSLGPLLLMFFQMFKDVGQLLILECFILAAISAGMSTLFASSLFASSLPGGTLQYDPLPLQCDEFMSLSGDFKSFVSVFYVFFNGVFTGSTHLECLYQYGASSHTEFWQLPWFYSMSFNIVTILLLLNMLIAMMAKTFDNVWESAEENSQYVLAQQCFLLDARPSSGTPLNVLRIPYVILLILVKLLNMCVGGRLDALVKELNSGLSFSILIDSKSPRAINLNKETNEFTGSWFNGRNTFESWKTGTPAEELNDFVIAFIMTRQDAGAQSSRWRSKMITRITSMVREESEKQEEKLNDVKAMITELRDGLMAAGTFKLPPGVDLPEEKSTSMSA